MDDEFRLQLEWEIAEILGWKHVQIASTNPYPVQTKSGVQWKPATHKLLGQRMTSAVEIIPSYMTNAEATLDDALTFAAHNNRKLVMDGLARGGTSFLAALVPHEDVGLDTQSITWAEGESPQAAVCFALLREFGDNRFDSESRTPSPDLEPDWSPVGDGDDD